MLRCVQRYQGDTYEVEHDTQTKTHRMTFYVYKFFDQRGRLLYVGRTSRLSRIKEQGRAFNWAVGATVTKRKFATLEQATLAERRAIIREKPIWNKQWNLS